MAKTVWLVDAFTNRPLTGNPAGVVPDADGLSAAQMQSIASELHASETAFVLSAKDSRQADFRLRYFTPTSEVDLCGHATIGSVSGLLAAGRLMTGVDAAGAQVGECKIETNVGVLPIRYGWSDGQPWAEMGQARPQFRDGAFDALTAAQMLGISVALIDDDLPMGMSYTGLWDVFVPLRTVATVQQLQPDLGRLSAWNQSLGAASTHVYARGGVEPGHDFHTRDFSPAVGVPEDPATGTATGALTALLYRSHVIDAGATFAFEQGYEMGRSSVVYGRAARLDDGLAVYVRGTAVVSLTGQLHL
ncbi:PhzF family phenazine biosynthesis protein [Alicyclobacillus sp. ALC3]|uniref:PhzF family phenazine biosynthesis protein n=1 Tax=Alicyclobacillus sp. ALC3 TaxID=2796143 RepID=UPI002378D6A1|nr:PhzF family phenazine biosynthesis protein [Alicyclobacillus sp. ALC3]WDL97307.1 PhzF family phenazine biosynthesis protein [Alicyclobacillus sp. ALC3]